MSESLIYRRAGGRIVLRRVSRVRGSACVGVGLNGRVAAVLFVGLENHSRSSFLLSSEAGEEEVHEGQSHSNPHVSRKILVRSDRGRRTSVYDMFISVDEGM